MNGVNNRRARKYQTCFIQFRIVSLVKHFSIWRTSRPFDMAAGQSRWASSFVLRPRISSLSFIISLTILRLSWFKYSTFALRLSNHSRFLFLHLNAANQLVSTRAHQIDLPWRLRSKVNRRFSSRNSWSIGLRVSPFLVWLDSLSGLPFSETSDCSLNAKGPMSASLGQLPFWNSLVWNISGTLSCSMDWGGGGGGGEMTGKELGVLKLGPGWPWNIASMDSWDIVHNWSTVVVGKALIRQRFGCGLAELIELGWSGADGRPIEGGNNGFENAWQRWTDWSKWNHAVRWCQIAASMTRTSSRLHVRLAWETKSIIWKTRYSLTYRTLLKLSSAGECVHSDHLWRTWMGSGRSFMSLAQRENGRDMIPWTTPQAEIGQTNSILLYFFGQTLPVPCDAKVPSSANRG